MSSKRRNLLILTFVFGLIALSAVVILNQPTKLGLDLKGGVELVYEGTPTGQVEEVTGEDIERSINIIRERIDRLGVAEPEVSRLGNTQITVSLPDVTNAQRAIDQVGTTAQLYFYDWEPNLIGPEKVIGGGPGQPPPRPVLKASEKRWEDAKRDPKKPQNAQLIAAGAYPTAYEAALLGSEQEPAKNCENCSVAKPRFYLFERKSPHELIAGPELSRKDLFISPTGEKRPKNGLVVEVPAGTILVSEYPVDPAIRRAGPEHQARLVRDQRRPGALGHRHHRPRTDRKGNSANRSSPSNSPTTAGRHSTTSPGRSPAAANRRRSACSAGRTRKNAPATSRSSSTTKSRPGRSSTTPKTRTGSTAAPGRRSPAASQDISEAQDLATTLQIGALPINLKLISQTQVSATLGSQALDDGIKAAVIGLILAILFLLLYYRFLGLIASIALGAYGVIFFALIKLIPITLTLPGIAGLVLTIGVAADSNIVIFERIKEEVRAGRTMSSAIAAGYKRGIATIIDANVVTLLTAFILFVLATAGVKGFAFTLGVGTIVSLLTAVVFTQALLGSMNRTRMLRSPAMLGASGQGRQWHFDFMGASRWFFSISGVILLVGALALATKQLNFGIDFESGTRVKVALVEPTDEEGVRDSLDSIGVNGEEIQQVTDPVLGSNVFQVQTQRARARAGAKRSRPCSKTISGSPKTASTAPVSVRPSDSRSPTAR